MPTPDEATTRQLLTGSWLLGSPAVVVGPGGTFDGLRLGGELMDDTTRVELYRTMVLIRAFEAALLRDYHADKKPQWDIGAGLIPGEMHLAAGQEPVAAGVCAHLNTDDAITGPHRPHHLAIAHGIDLDRMAAEIYGRETGLSRGKGGHMHLFDPVTHFSCSGIIAEGYPVSCGQAFAFKRQGTGRISVAVAGEGAANQGAFHESLNLAALWRLPVVFVIEDNDWAISVPRSKSTAGRVERRARRGLRHPRRAHRGQRRRGDLRGWPARPWPGRGPDRVRACWRSTRCGSGATSRATPRPTEAPSSTRSTSATRSRSTRPA